MTDFAAIADLRLGGFDSLAPLGGQAFIRVLQAGPKLTDGFASTLLPLGGGIIGPSGGSLVVPTVRDAVEQSASLGDTWYEIVHVFPFSFAFGNVLTTVVETIIVYNADRFVARTFSSFTNNAGGGITITDLPPLPLVLGRQSGLSLTLEVTSDGPPTINGTLDFAFGTDVFMLPVTGNRIVMFPFVPDLPLRERLRFLTEIFEHKDGTEQRVALREFPRQEFSFPVLREEGEELTRFEILMFDWQARVFGLPVWTERARLAADIAVNDTVITVDSTAYADFRVGGLAIVHRSEVEFEALEIAAIGSSTITFATPFGAAFPAGSLVMPIRTALASPSVRGVRWRRNLARRELSFRVLDNDVASSFPDASPWVVNDAESAVNGEIFLSGLNAVGGTLSESVDRRVQVFDNGTGKFSVGSTTPYNTRGSAFRFVPKSRAELWKVRRLLHALRGRQVSFFVPTGFRDLTVTQDWNNGTGSITIKNVGFNQFARQRNRFAVVRIELTDGTVLVPTITGSSVVSASEEIIAVSLNAPRNIVASEFSRVEFLERVRLSSDDVTIDHVDGTSQTVVEFGVRSVIT